jgi:salicylate hydroxylase
MGSTTSPLSGSSGLHVSIIGGGITGVTLALGLQARSVDFTIFERASALKEIGAGIGFSPNAERALFAMNPELHKAYKRVTTPNGEDYFQWIDGKESDHVVYKLYLGEQGFQGCRRSDFLEEMLKLVPREKVKFDKEIEEITEDTGKGDGKVGLRFKDGTVERTDVGKSHGQAMRISWRVNTPTSRRLRRDPFPRPSSTPRVFQPSSLSLLHP